MKNRKLRDLDGATIKRLGYVILAAGVVLPLVLVRKLDVAAVQQSPETLLIYQVCMGLLAVAVLGIGWWVWASGAAKLEVEQRASANKGSRPHTPRPVASIHPAKRRK
jgi:hypothetical protein